MVQYLPSCPCFIVSSPCDSKLNNAAGRRRGIMVASLAPPTETSPLIMGSKTSSLNWQVVVCWSVKHIHCERQLCQIFIYLNSPWSPHPFHDFEVVFFGQFCDQSGNHPLEDLAKFGYNWDMKVNQRMFLTKAQLWEMNQCLHLAI